MESVLLNVDLPGLKLFKRGKVRDVFELDDCLLLVASDRISAFDSVMPNGIPDKGKILTQISLFWFDFTKTIINNHILNSDVKSYPDQLKPHADVLAKRSVLVKKAKLIPIECIVRGYLSGSGWKDYQKSGAICGVSLPSGLTESARLPEPIFTPTTKAEQGHDENITERQVIDLIGAEAAKTLKEKSLEIYRASSEYAETKGIIIADTKFEFGYCGDEIIIIDEMLTPDSSRFWPKQLYKAGKSQPSFDKQFVRDYLESIGWDKEPPAPKLPEEVVSKTREKYLEAFQKLTGKADL
ncbi:phosphoribosylaminoimidazolesuccinocarboxamide synthase [candidate division WOR-1 bacterium RIFOXYA12_FULL_52_29]|uniref:Phosphoribosylaminoimidazole-succinocarboxamide synthase n=1 Tax=candidate division WOR-1 bacterium RIFOXYC12_FULL_54_18 TaxID=1802584 RepID=A0A1F4T5F5_UNCSA|nr:MAG: phosphoribosylaminoimidazolesuccinocarboxamide synthase [candidate division WOR-1 bacterium RIFOXYA2_FULL_51_19]OGC17379.1 MAG: phosphoribosylaminoimidazolesuccinocarboxamide synthase [candidate division WOR-1 bacterium RIFOXYA12_FULL_52_29]OGC26238.1 MAG: phosphoribosylaminoimidazolesuccinocarboxamide synthase [candidate division WOR-1 bacterium RIFOXYB2_FULL_45_9]OGC27796.1 MAG: phosphoribosylaminoimidazolesuccinocarboxamide synthase [candidate division WOR-1 bacterium RIFOXYC12_FULL_5